MYTELTLIVEGALEESQIFYPADGSIMDAWIEACEEAAQLDGMESEIFKLEHNHEVTLADCTCAQFVTDHHPIHHWNKKEAM